MSRSRESHLSQPERTPNPSYSEQDFGLEVEENRQRNIRVCEKNLEGEKDPQFIKAWKKLREGFDDPEWTQWTFIHEFTRLLPTGLDREDGTMDKKLLQDLDAIIKKHYDYDRYVYLQNRKNELIRLQWKRKLSNEEESELKQIEDELDKVDLKLLYMEMRKLGYTPKDLKTARG